MVATNRRIAALAAVAVSAVTVLLGATPAVADRTAVNATGNSTIQLGGPFLRALESNGCGPLTATATGDGTVFTTGAGKIKAVLPVTGLVLTDTGALRIAHAASGVNLANACYEVKLSNFYIQDLGDTHQTVYYDVLAKAKSVDEGGDRILVFRLDTTPAHLVVVPRPNSVTTKVFNMDLLLGDEGADEFNQLATGDENVGPFAPGQLVGKARTSVRFSF